MVQLKLMDESCRTAISAKLQPSFNKMTFCKKLATQENSLSLPVKLDWDSKEKQQPNKLTRSLKSYPCKRAKRLLSVAGFVRECLAESVREFRLAMS